MRTCSARQRKTYPSETLKLVDWLAFTPIPSTGGA
jgi:hypothetical protein